ncbi:MAG TPA: PepSY-associated TM helix domain-containing protein [Aromatoleum sp.]|uniref:PepSY-associated TM helix domain-containing protein n=1 Tax=Aromatoleum sp. TaxID=2307007 RepID=UPI002B477BEC|nr:PepSY-associated TM helix domain-containing protein [Aromatoleum sp.]HJV24947.1 PepSY-associated TM helix domain-containing protein [Aromatoleum sp.]
MIHLHPRPGNQRGNSQKWLRRIHAWFGLGVSAMLLLFAVTGFLLNHRAVMKIPALDRKEVTQLMPVEATPTDPLALAAALAPGLGLDAATLKPKIDPARAVAWSEAQIVQPERWTLRADMPSESVHIEYWKGSRQAEVKRTQPNLWLYLARLHMSTGAGPGWVLLADAAALGLAFLGLSGFWLWGRLHGSRRQLGMIASGGLVLAGGLAWLAG